MFGYVKKEKVLNVIEEEIRSNWRKMQHYQELLDEEKELDEETKNLYRERIRYARNRRDEAARIFGYVRHTK